QRVGICCEPVGELNSALLFGGDRCLSAGGRWIAWGSILKESWNLRQYIFGGLFRVTAAQDSRAIWFAKSAGVDQLRLAEFRLCAAELLQLCDECGG
ncbi:MAG: hypothetical protein ACKPHU_30380, partial [Planctomycetaceae bacterium]